MTSTDERNAFGSLVDKNGNPWICTHGGSQWLCQSCADSIIKEFPNNHRKTTSSERYELRTWEQQHEVKSLFDWFKSWFKRSP